MENLTPLKIHALVMAGGKGTRFWPESTSKKPKQYLNLLSDVSLLEQTLDRFEGLVIPENRFVVTVSEQGELCAQNSKAKIGTGNIIFEPSGRNTGPCILLSLATFLSRGMNKSDLVAIVPSDHVILNHQGFRTTIAKAAQHALNNQEIVLIGITPHFPHTGFGYIEKGELRAGEIFKVSRFREKPHFEIAKEYVASGNYLWNAGMYVAPIGVILEEFAIHAPEMFAQFENLKANLGKASALVKVYDSMPIDSIDYAVLEKSNRVSVIPASFDWNDLGSWDALSAVLDEIDGNTLVKSDGAYFLNSKSNIIYAPEHFVSLINLQEHIVVVNEQSVLIAPVKDSQEVKKVVEHLKNKRPDLI